MKCLGRRHKKMTEQKAYETLMIGLFLVMGVLMVGAILDIPKIAVVSQGLIVGGLYFGVYLVLYYFDKSFLEEENKEGHKVNIGR